MLADGFSTGFKGSGWFLLQGLVGMGLIRHFWGEV